MFNPPAIVCLLLVGTLCIVWIIKVLASEGRRKQETLAVSQSHVIAADAERQQTIIGAQIAQHQLAALEANFQVYFENNLVTAPLDDITKARATFEAMHTEHPSS